MEHVTRMVVLTMSDQRSKNIGPFFLCSTNKNNYIQGVLHTSSAEGLKITNRAGNRSFPILDIELVAKSIAEFKGGLSL